MGNKCFCGETDNSGQIKPPVPLTLSKIEDDTSASSDAESTECEEIPEPPPGYGATSRKSVCGEVYGAYNRIEDVKLPVHAKSPDQQARIESAIKESFLFASLVKSEMEMIVKAFKEYTALAGTRIITQGEEGDCLYLIESGQVEILKQKSSEDCPSSLGTLGEGDVFGELALMYNSPRAATIVAKTKVVCWSLDRATFNVVIREAARHRREHYEGFLAKVSLLRDMDAYERTKVADALVEKRFGAGEVIITDGDIGEEFFMLVQGEAQATKQGTLLCTYREGSYFGELALIRSQPRAATVTATLPCVLLCLSARSFKRLLGSVEHLLRRNMATYKEVLLSLGLPPDPCVA